MPRERLHRAVPPEDRVLFDAAAVAKLRVAAEECAWLLERGYPRPTVLRTVGGHHQLDARQRLALERAVCSPSEAHARAERAVLREGVRGAELAIDAFNLIITLEVALAGGVVLGCMDGTVRDLAGLRGSYVPVAETDAALVLIAEELALLGVAGAAFFVDAPISSSGRLKARIEARVAVGGVPVTAELVGSADPVLAERDFVVTSDSGILDVCGRWVNLAAWIVERRVPGAWRVELG